MFGECLRNLHEHKGVEVLQSVEEALDDMCTLACLCLALSWVGEEGGRLSNGSFTCTVGVFFDERRGRG